MDWERIEPGIYRRTGQHGKSIYRAVRQAGERQQVRTFNSAKAKDALRQARAFRADGLAKSARGESYYFANESRTLQQAYDALHADPDASYAPSTSRWHDDLWRRLPDDLKARKLKDINQATLQRALASIAAPTVRDRARVLVGLVYRHAGMAAVSPATKPYAPSTRSSRSPTLRGARRKVLSNAEVEALIRATSSRTRALIRLLWRVGLRPGEAFALTVGQIDPETRRLTIDRAANDGVVGPTKTGKTRHPVVPAGVFKILTDHIREYSDWTNPDALVFPNTAGHVIHGDTFRHRVFMPAAKAAGIQVVPMDLRHTAASNMIAAGIDVVTVAESTGHSVAVLLKVYAHAVDEQLSKAAERLDAVFG
jgi:integrase